MKLALASLFLVPALLLAVPEAFSAPRGDKPRAYKPAERRQQEAETSRAAAADPGERAPVTTYEQELQAAKEKRDQDLDNAAGEAADRRSLEKKKQEIFSQYAAIVAALRDKYEAAHPDEAAPSRPAPGKAKGRPKTARPKPIDPAEEIEARPKSKPGKRKGRTPTDTLADAQEKLDEENARHAAKVEQLNGQLKQAESSDNPRETRRVQKLIDKENNTYNATRRVLERRIQDLGGAVSAPASEPAPPQTTSGKT